MQTKLEPAKKSPKPRARVADTEPALPAFLSFLEKELTHRPEFIEPASRAQLKRIGKLVASVKIA